VGGDRGVGVVAAEAGRVEGLGLIDISKHTYIKIESNQIKSNQIKSSKRKKGGARYLHIYIDKVTSR
jgi:hypothetical protein